MDDTERKNSPKARTDAAVGWILSVIVLGFFGANQASAAIATGSPLRWIAPCTLVIAVLATSPGGALHWSRAGATRGALLGGIASLVAYLAIAVYVGSSRAELAWQIVEVTCLWLASTLLSWQSLRASAPMSDVALGAATLLGGVTFLTIGVAGLSARHPLFSAGSVLVGVMALLTGALELGTARVTPRERMGFLVLAGGGTGMALIGIGSLQAGAPLTTGAVCALSGLAVTAIGALGWLGRIRSVGVVLLLLGVTLIATSRIASEAEGRLTGVAGVLIGSALLFAGVAAFFVRDPRHPLLGIASVFMATGMLVLGVGALYRHEVLMGAAAALLGLAGLMSIAAALNDGAVVRATQSGAAKAVRILGRRRDQDR